MSSSDTDAQLHSVLENALDAVVSMDVNGLILQWNPQAEKIFGFRRGEVVGKRMSETIVPHRYRDAHEKGMKRYLASGEGPLLNRRVEISALRADGIEIPVELAITPVREGGERVFYAFLRDISERRLSEDERTRLLVELQEAIRKRDEFISVASHELKTPVSSLKLQFQMAARQAKLGDRRVFSEQSVLERIESSNRQIDRMARLIDDMLDVSRVDSGRFKMGFEETELGSLVEEVVRRFKEQFEAAGSSLEFDPPPSLPIECDRYRIDQVVTNLLTNALKYGAGKPVRVTVEPDGERARIRVQDRGIGISPESLPRIFERFERAVTTRQHVSGLGLGLYISKQIVDAHRGEIIVESEPGRGSAFTVVLPLRQSQTTTEGGGSSG